MNHLRFRSEINNGDTREHYKRCSSFHTFIQFAELEEAVVMSLKKLLSDTQLPLNAVFFPEENMTGIAPTKLTEEKENTAVGKTVTVNWQGKKVQPEIISLSIK